MAIGAIAGLIAKFGIPIVGGFIANKLAGRRARRAGRRGAGGTELPGGGTATQIPKLDPKTQKALEDAYPKIIEELFKEPEKFPELTDILQQQAEAFGPQPELPPEVPINLPGMEELQQLDFAPIEAQARQKFAQETIPGLAERFTALTGGGQRAGAFERQKAQAGTELETGLAALRAQMEPEYAMRRAQFGLKRGEAAGRLGLLQQQLRGGLQQQGRAQRLSEAQFAMQRAGAAQAPGQQRLQMLSRLLGGGVASPYDTVVQPPRPGFWQGAAPGIGGLLGGLGQAAGQYLFGGQSGLFK